ncbi:hypothetical protein [Priestia megaterium]|uniref:hypothetical protein n=1 Tax=Priestia megaterium TaxID=1404 RepID=UPI003A87E626
MGQGPCLCKFRLGIAGNKATATVTVKESGTTTFTGSGTINFSAVQCFTGARKCNPAVNNFKITFESNGGDTINFTQGRRGMISCFDNTEAVLMNGTAKVSGNVIQGQGKFDVDFSYSIDTSTNPDTATIIIVATRNNTEFTTTFTAPVSPQTFIGDCNEKP